MDLISIGETLWRHKRVSIPVLFLTLLGVVYVIVFQTATYQADASVLLTNPSASSSALQAANPFASLGNLTYVADVLIDEVSAAAGRAALSDAGASGYEVGLADSSQTPVPPAVAITGTGASAQAAIQTVRLVSSALAKDLAKMQRSKHVPAKYTINEVEYVTPTSAVKVSSGSMRVAIGVVAIGLIALLVAVSMAQGLEGQNRRPHRERRPAHREGARRAPADSSPDYSPRQAPAPAMQPTDHGSRYWGQNS